MTIQDKFDSLQTSKWPFKNMKVGDIEVFSGENKTMAATTAHAYGRQLGMKFKTRKDRETGDIYVKRIA